VVKNRCLDILVEDKVAQCGGLRLRKWGGSRRYWLHAVRGDTLPLMVPIAVQINAICIQPAIYSVGASRGAIGIHQRDEVKGNLRRNQIGRGGEIGKKRFYEPGRVFFIAAMYASY
jgi:hypothetical protein